MANRFWRGDGDQLWNGTAGTKWSSTSGGAGGASVPTIDDDVFFDANSLSRCTISTGNLGAKSMSFTSGFNRTLDGTANISVAGSVTLTSAMSYAYSGTMTFTGTGTYTTAGRGINGNIVIDGVGITVTLGDAFTGNLGLTVTNGTFTTNNFAVTCQFFNSNNANVRTINLGSSTFNLSNVLGVSFQTSTNLTFNAGTSQINLNSSAANLEGGSQTFHNVSMPSTAIGTRIIGGANTFNNLTLNASATGMTQFSIEGNQTVNGTLTCAGSSAIARAFVRSDFIGTTRTITANAISANDCDFRDITLAGTASGASPTRAGDCGGNSGITFPAAKNCFRVGVNSTWQGSNSWALTSGGAGSNNNFPLAQDTAIINNSTAFTGNLGIGTFNVGAIDCSSRTNAITLNSNAFGNFYGSITLSASTATITGGGGSTFSGRGVMTFTSAGQSVLWNITIDAPDGTFQLGDAFVNTQNITFRRGTLNANNYNFTCNRFASAQQNVRTLTMGSGLWTLSGDGAVWAIDATNLTFNKDTANILLSNITTSARTFQGFGLTYNKLTIGGATGTSTLTFTEGSTFSELASTKTVAHTISFNNASTIFNTWSVAGTAGNLVTVNSNTVGTRRTFTLTNVTSGIDYLNVRDIGIASPDRFFVGTESTDSGNNLNVIFTNPPALTATGNMFMMF